MPGWKRPETVPFPSIWRRFDGRNEINGKMPKFWIQDLPEDMFETAVDFMCMNFIVNEPLCRFSNLIDEPESVEEIKQTWRLLVKDKLAIVCFMENENGPPIITGMNMTYASVKDEVIPEFKGKKWLKTIDSVMYLTHKTDPFEKFGIQVYLSALGLSVLPEYSGQGIGFELLEARTDLCKAVGLPATLTVFTASVSQFLAEKSGFKDLVAMPYGELEAAEPRFRFPGITSHTKTIRYMYKVF